MILKELSATSKKLNEVVQIHNQDEIKTVLKYSSKLT